MKSKILLLLLFAVIASAAYSQRIEILGIDPTYYPKIKGEIIIYDKDGKQFKGYSASDLILTENGKSRVITKSHCPDNITKFSAILTIDISKSMDSLTDQSNPNSPKRIELARSVARVWIDQLDTTRAECAITSFDQVCEINQEFTHHKSLLYSAIENRDSIRPRGGTNYNAAFLKDRFGRSGALEVARKAKYKPIIVFLTDGFHDRLQHGPILFNEILALADTLNCTIFSLTLGMPMPSELANISYYTGGQSFASLTNPDLVQKIYLDILKQADNIGITPCDFEFDTDCSGGGTLRLTYSGFNVSKNFQYTIPEKYKPSLEIVPKNVYFFNAFYPENVSQSVRLYARNNSLVINNYDNDNPRYEIDWLGRTLPISLKKDEFIDVRIVYKPTADTSYSIAKNFNFTGSSCSNNDIIPSAGYIFTNEIDMGSSLVNERKDVEFSQVICNRSGQKIRIDRHEIIDDPDLEFWMLEPPTPFDIEHNKCMRYKFRFDPKQTGKRQARLKLYSGSDIYYVNLKGTGIGKGALQAIEKVQFANLLCGNTTPYKDTLIYIKNIGWEAIELKSITIDGDNKDDFKVQTPPASLLLQAFGKDSLMVRFQPTLNGLRSADLIIESNDESNPFYYIALSGVKDTASISSSFSEIDFGYICPGETADTTFYITNTGTVPVGITLSIDEGNFDVSEERLFLPNGATMQVGLSFTSSASESGFVKKMRIVTDECNFLAEVVLKATVESPKISAETAYFYSTVGVSKDSTITINNPSDRDLLINEVFSEDSRFIVIEPTLPFTINSKENIQIKVRFTPNTDKPVTAKIYFKGEPCEFADSIEVVGSSTLATANLKIDKHTGLVGEIVSIPVKLGNKKLFAESGATTIDLSVSFDDCLLEPVPPTPTGYLNGSVRIIPFTDISVSGNNDESLVELRLLVKDCPAIKRTDLNITEAASGNAAVSYTKTSGEFQIVTASATISTISISASAGEMFDIPILISNTNHVSSFHEEIESFIVFSGDVIEPLEPTEHDIFNDGKWRMKLTAPAREAKQPLELSKVRVRAMLGKTVSSPIAIEEANVKTGKVEFSIVSGTFTLKDICESGGLRLFDANGTAGISNLKPNPSDGLIMLEYDVLEKGHAKIWLSDIAGIRVTELLSAELEPGKHELQLNLLSLRSGVYFLIYQTPTRRFVERVSIVK